MTQGMKVYAPSKITTEANGLRTIPPTFKSLILTIPVAKTTILGGVATGNAKAQLHAKTMGIMNVNGFTCIEIAMEAAMGVIIDAVATLDVTSVSQMTNVMNMKSKAAVGMDCSWASASPSHMDKPLWLKPSANANPPPNKRTRICAKIVR